MKFFIIVYNAFRIVLVLLSILVLTYCSNKEFAIKKKWMGKEIILPEINSENKKIVVRFLGDCSSCVETIEPWKDFNDIVKQKNDQIDLVFYVDIIDEERFEELREQLNFADYVIFDQRNAFFRKNLLQFPYDIDYQVFLLNGKNEIMFFGSPVYHKELEKKYFKKIEKL